MLFRSGIALLLSLSLISCRSQDSSAPPPPVEVNDYVVEPKTIPAVFEFVGFAQSSHPVEIRARVEGYLDKIAYDEGKLVQENQLLFQLDPRPFEAKVAQAKADIARQEALVANAKMTVDRLTPLYAQNAASKKDLDNAIANQLATQADLLLAQATLLEAEINLGYTTITSPITGYTEKARLREGALINPASNTLMTTVSVLDPIWIYFTISDADILQATHDAKPTANSQGKVALRLPKDEKYTVEVVMSDGTTYPQKGIVDYSSPTYDQSTGTLQARAVFNNPEAELRPGQFVRVKVYGAERPNAIFVPQRALMQKKNGMFVYLINKKNKVVEQDVSVGAWYDDYQVITNGLKAGDHIIVDGINKVRPGMTVKVVGPWQPPKANGK